MVIDTHTRRRRSRAPPTRIPLLAVPNITTHPSTASVPISCNSMWHYNSLCTLKATFHYSSQLQTWLQTWFSTRFSTSSCGFATCFRHAFNFYLSKTWSRTCCINLDVRSLLGFKQVCSWLSTCFRPACDVLSTRSRKSKGRLAVRFAAC